jgi:TonB family protein
MGVVYLAEDPLIGRQVAIKGIRFDAHSDDAEIRRLQERFDQEIQIAGTFSHPNIVTLYDVGREGGRSFIAMEYVDGRNLRSALQASGPLSAARAIGLIAPVCRALTYAHERKVIHRDIKPTNILVSSEGVPKITDFGVARLFGSTLTNAGKIFGTPAYMSPEQARGAELTGASDQFAVAAVLYELLTGERPFRGTSPTAVIYEVLETFPPPPHEIAPLVPTAVGAAVMRGLAKEPEDRFESCASFADALEAAVSWSKANPELAYLDLQAPEFAQDNTIATAGVWTDRLEEAWKRASQALAAASTSDVWRDTRSLAARIAAAARSTPASITGDPRNLGLFVAGTLSLVVLIAVVAWLASSGGDAVQPPSGASQAELLTATERFDRAALPAPGNDNPGAHAPTATNGEPGAAERSGATNDGRTSFVVATRPRGARVSLDGEVLGDAAPVSFDLTDDEPHTLRLEMDGYEPLAWAFSRSQLSARHLESGELYFPLSPLAGANGASGALTETTIPTPASLFDLGAVAPASDEASADEWAGYGISGPPPSPTNVRRVRAPSQAPAPEKLRHVDLRVPAAMATNDGVVVMEIEVSARGNVVQAKILRGLDPLINQAALDAVVRWKYRPTAISGEPVHVVMTVTLPVRSSDRR